LVSGASQKRLGNFESSDMPKKIAFLVLSIVLTCALSTHAEAIKRLLLIGQSPDGVHPATTHEYLPGVRVLENCLKDVPGLEITVVKADGLWKEGPELIERADGVVLFVAEGAKWLEADPKRYEAMSKMADRGGGLVALHWAIGSREAQPIAGFVKLFGGCHGGPDRKYKVVETEAEIADPKLPIVTGVKNFKTKDEFYYRLKFAQPADNIKPVVRVSIDGAKEIVAWAWERPDGGRSFGYSGLHFHDNWKLPEVRRMVAQGVLWTVKLPIPKDGLPVQMKDEDVNSITNK
jgi:type 1 glutamine amidotransferase